VGWWFATIAGFARRTRFFLLCGQKKEPKEKATLGLPPFGFPKKDGSARSFPN
jgi:hypothetical protein